MRVVVDAKAWTDIDQIGAWIAKEDPRAAREILRRIVASIAPQLRAARPRPGYPRTCRRGNTLHHRLRALE